MRLKSARLHGLMGVFSASGKKEIFIDFTKCLNDIILIIGKNGSGKTTIWEALQPIPLPTYKFIEKEPGFIELEYVHNDVLYNLRIEYPITNSRERAQTKAFITKTTSDGTVLELNPNGNIGSYKSALFSEFNLDPNFISLSQLSSEDMGIVSKKPSERKKFVASIVESIEVYNDIYKTLSKRSSIFKSMINSITAKIDTIGNKENLLTQLNALDNRLQRLNAERDRLLKQVALSESTIHLTDPNGSIQNIYKTVSDELYSIHQQLNGYEIYVKKITDSFGTIDLDELTKMYKETNDQLSDISRKIDKANDEIQSLLLSKEEEAKYIQIKTARVNSLQAEFNFDYLKERIKYVTKAIGECEMVFSKLNLPKNHEITKDEFIHGVQIISNIKEAISTVKSFATESDLNKVLYNLKNDISFIDECNNAKDHLRELRERERDLENGINKYNEILTFTADLNKRPSNCKIDDCPFIKTALEAFNKKPEENIKLLEKQLIEVQTSIFDEEAFLYSVEQAVKIEQMISNIIRTINITAHSLNKFPTGKYLTDINTFLDNFTNVIMLNELTELQESLHYANVFEQYKSLQTELIKLESDYKIYENKVEIIEELNNEISDLSTKLSRIVLDLEIKRKDILEQQEIEFELENKITSLDSSINILRKRAELESKRDSLVERLAAVTNNMEAIKQELEKQNVLNSQIANIDKDIRPASEEKDKIVYSLKQLEEYNAELSIYNEKYTMIELIKKYSSPTKGGIQTLFMQLYMGKTISMANDLLALLFDGKFELLPYIINESEFRIPCVNKESSVHHDDISSCSSAERAMISMMISFSLLHHSSTVYNILRLDEIDGALDQNNRSRFLVVLDKFMKELGVENCIMISHSSEMDMSNVDIIQLTPVDNNKPNGNIIFTYND